MREHHPGDHLVFGIIREGKRTKADVTLAVMPPEARLAWEQNLRAATQHRLKALSQNAQ
jgi:hypothetical protein